MSGKLGQKSVKPTETPSRYSEDFLALMDRRSKVARLLKQRLNELQNDLGGEDNLSYAKRSLIRRAIFIEAQLEKEEAEMAQGNEVNLGSYFQATNSLLGLFKTLGLDRQVKELDLQNYLRGQK